MQDDEARISKAASRKYAAFLALKAAGEPGLTVPEIAEAARKAATGGSGFAEWEPKDVNNMRSVRSGCRVTPNPSQCCSDLHLHEQS